MAGDRMARVWSPTTTAGPIAVPAGAVFSAVLVPGVDLVTTQDRRMRDWTVTRIVGSLQFVTTGTTTFYYGIRVYNENETATAITPGSEPTADWMFWGAVTTENASFHIRDQVVVDNRSQRKSRGMESELRIVIQNSGNNGSVAWTGRCLLLVP